MRDFLRKHYLLIIILLVGTFFRFDNLGMPVLNTDEAEVYLSSQAIFESGVPRGFYKIPFYENAYLYESNSTMYEFEPTNYYKTDLVLKKGWLTYYIIAFFSLFGKSEFALRFPFALIGVISLFLFYRLTKLLFNERTALIASFFYAVSPSLIFYERMVRYYSPMILFVILSIFFFVKAIRYKEKKDYIAGTISLGLLFHTNIMICFALFLTIIIFGLLQKVKLNRKVIHSAIIFGVLTIPWILGTGFLWKIASEPRVNGLQNVYIEIIAGISNQGSLYFIFFLSCIILLGNIFFRAGISKTIFFWNKKYSCQLGLIYLILMVIIPLLLVPVSSFDEKIFLTLIIFGLMIIAAFFDSILYMSKNKLFQYSIIIVILLFTFVSVDTSLGFKGHNYITYKQILTLQKSNFFEDIQTTIESNTLGNPLVLSTSEHFPLMFYTNYSVQIIWPVRKEFIDNYEEELIIIETGYVEGNCNFFYQYMNYGNRCEKNKNYLEKINDCEIITINTIDTTTNIYFCKAQKKFIGTNQGLFFRDFPKEMPPDFIWDQIPFPVSANVNNLGETDVNSLKISFSGDFLGREFEKEKEEFIFETNIPGEKKVLGEIITSSEYFSLGNISYKFKLPVKQKYVNASIKICYSYSTNIAIQICEDSKNICKYDFSGAPIQIKEFYFDEQSFNFSVFNSGEGFLSKYNNCFEENITTKPLSIQSDIFECEEKNDKIFCEGDEGEIKPNKEYIIIVHYDYEEEFKKAILLRSRERNEYDYENFYEKE